MTDVQGYIADSRSGGPQPVDLSWYPAGDKATADDFVSLFEQAAGYLAEDPGPRTVKWEDVVVGQTVRFTVRAGGVREVWWELPQNFIELGAVREARARFERLSGPVAP